MSVTARAVICFGVAIPLTEDGGGAPAWLRRPSERYSCGYSTMELGEAIARHEGILPVYGDISLDEENARYFADEEGQFADQYRAYDAACHEISAAAGVAIITHGHHENEKYMLVIPDSETEVELGEVYELPEAQPEPHAGWSERIQSVCQRLGVSYGEPKWLLVVYHG